MIYVKKGDRRPFANTTLLRGTTVVNLTAAVGVTFRMRERYDRGILITGAAVITGATLGTVQYQWAAGNTTTPGLYLAEWVVDFGGGQTETFPTLGFDTVLIEGNLAA
jgi:hypothetical protein